MFSEYVNKFIITDSGNRSVIRSTIPKHIRYLVYNK